RGALAAEADDAVVQLGGLRGLEAGAGAALQRPGRTHRVHRVQARADMAAEHLVVVVADAAGQRKPLDRLPGVLREQRVHVVFLPAPRASGLHAEHAVGQLAAHHLRAEHRHVFASGLERDVEPGVQGVLRALQRALRTRQVAQQLLVLLRRQVGLHDRQLLRLGLVVPGIGVAEPDRRARGAVAAGADAAAQVGAGGVPQLLQLPALGHGEGQGAAPVVGLHVGQRDQAGAEGPAALVGQGPAVAGEFLRRRVAGARFDAAVVADAQHRAVVVHGADRILLHAFVVDADGVVVFLARGVHVQGEGLAVGRGPGQADAAGLVGVVHGLAAAAEAQRTAVALAGRVGHVVVYRVGGIAPVPAAAHGQVQPARHQRAGEVEIGGAVVAVVVIGLEGAAQGQRAGPGVQALAGDDVDHAAHGVGAVQGRHRAADHLDALDRVQRRDVVALVAAEGVRIDVAVVVLAAAVDQDQGGVRAHAAHRDRALAGLVAGLADVHALQVADRVQQGDVRALGQVLAGDHADAGRCVDDLLLIAGGGDHHGV